MWSPVVITHDSPHRVSDVRSLVHEHGAVLLRGWPGVDGPAAFARLVADCLGVPPRRDMACSAGPRTDLGHGVFTANEAPSHVAIPSHHEMAQCTNPPAYVAFYCETPPPRGGCTPVLRSSDAARELRRAYPRVADRLAARGLRYTRTFAAHTDAASALGKSWRDTFGVRTREEAEAVLARHPDVASWTWHARRDALTTVGPVRAVLLRRGHDDEVLFLAAETALADEDPPSPSAPRKGVVDEKGQPLSPQTASALRHVGEFARVHSTRIPWQASDVLLLDNGTVMHARDAFDPPRRVLVLLAGDLANP
jgi:alpha-ketoglutarate-dependent taurine dioxygenase